MKKDFYKIKISDSEHLALSFEKGELMGSKIEVTEKGKFVTVDYKSACKLFTSSLSPLFTLVGSTLVIKNGFNTNVVKTIEGVKEESSESVDPLEELTVEELKDKATELGLKGIHNAKKETLIEKIKAEME